MSGETGVTTTSPVEIYWNKSRFADHAFMENILNNKWPQILSGIVLAVLLIYLLPQMIWNQDSIVDFLIEHDRRLDRSWRGNQKMLSARMAILGVCLAVTLSVGLLLNRRLKYLAVTLWLLVLPMTCLVYNHHVYPLTMSSRVRPAGQYLATEIESEKKPTPYYLTVNRDIGSNDSILRQ